MNLLILVDHGSLGCAIPLRDVTSLMRDAKRGPARFVMPVAQHNHRSAVYHSCKPLEAGHRQQVGWNDGNPASPQVLEDGVQGNLAVRPADLPTPDKAVGRRGRRRRHRLLQITHDGSGDAQCRVDRRCETRPVDVADASKSGSRVRRGLQR